MFLWFSLCFLGETGWNDPKTFASGNSFGGLGFWAKWCMRSSSQSTMWWPPQRDLVGWVWINWIIYFAFVLKGSRVSRSILLWVIGKRMVFENPFPEEFRNKKASLSPNMCLSRWFTIWPPFVLADCHPLESAWGSSAECHKAKPDLPQMPWSEPRVDRCNPADLKRIATNKEKFGSPKSGSIRSKEVFLSVLFGLRLDRISCLFGYLLDQPRSKY